MMKKADIAWEVFRWTFGLFASAGVLFAIVMLCIELPQ